MKSLLLAFLFLPLGLLAQTKDKPLPAIIGAIAKPVDQTTSIPSEEAKNHLGETIMVCGVVVDGRYLESSATQPTLINLGAAFPNQHLTIFISKEVRATLGNKPEEFYKDKKVCITGKITDYKGKPQIVLTAKEDIKVE